MILSCIDELKLPELEDAETNLPENHKDNCAMPPVITQLSPPYSPLEDALVASSAPLLHQRVEAGNAALQAREGDLPDNHLLSANYMLYGFYQDWVHQNPGDHLDGGIVEGSKLQAQWEKLVCMPTQRYDAPSGKVGKIFVGIL